MRKNKSIIVIMIGILLASCGDFLSEYPKDFIYVGAIEDLDEMLVGEGYMVSREIYGTDGESAIPAWIHVMDDDVEIRMTYGQESPYKSFYNWMEQPFLNEYGLPVDDNVWSRLYQHISALNVILGKVEEFKDEREGYCRVKGQARFLRADYYFWLINLYAKPYQKASAAITPGIPLKLSAPIEDKLYSRTSVGEVYEAIIQDLQESAQLLREVPKMSVYKANRAAAKTLLSRVYLYMGAWEKVIAECDTVIEAGYELMNFNELAEGKSTIYATSQETIFTQGENRVNELLRNDDVYRVSDDLISAFYDKENDLRYLCTIAYDGDEYSGTYVVRKLRKWGDGGVSDCSLFRLAEIYLNKAEALAMLGRDREANDVLQFYLEHRFKIVPTLGKTGKDLVDFIRNERRLELCMEGHRWFDLRRYAVTEKYAESKSIRHENYVLVNWVVMNKGYYELKEYDQDGGWVLPIPTYELIYNGSLMENNVRPSREMIEK